MEALVILAVLMFIATPCLVVRVLTRLDELQGAIASLSARIGAKEPATVPVAPTVPRARPAPRQPEVQREDDDFVVDVGKPTPAPRRPAQAPPPVPPEAQEPPEPAEKPASPLREEAPRAVREEPVRVSRAPKADLESVIGKTWLVRVGAVALILGLGFLYKWSIDEGLITFRQRAISGAVTGCVLWALGLRFRRIGYEALSQGFLGAGTAVLYLTIFAAEYWFDLISEQTAFGLMVVVTALTTVMAVRFNALSLVLLAQIGGFLTPVLVGNPEASPHALFTYLMVLNAGLLVAAAMRRWPVVGQVGWAATALLFVVQYADATPDRLGPWAAAAWASALAVTFHALPLIASWLRRERVAPADLGTIALNAGAWLALCWHALGREFALGATTLGLGVAHVVLSRQWAQRVRGDRATIETLSGLGAGLVFACVPLLMEASALTIGWALQGFVLVLIGARTGIRWLSFGGGLALLAALLRVANFHAGWHWASEAFNIGPDRGGAFFNTDFLAGLIVMIAIAAAAWAERRARSLGAITASLGALALFGFETAVALIQYFGTGPTSDAFILIQWALHLSVGALACCVVARMTRTANPLMVATPLAVGALLVAAVCLGRLQEAPSLLFLNPRFALLAAFPAMCGVATRLIRGIRGLEDDHEERVRILCLIAALTYPLFLVSFEVAGFFGRDGDSQRIHTALSVSWTGYGAILLVAGMIRRAAPLRRAALALLALTLVKVALVDLSFLDDLHRILSFIVLGVVLMGGAWLYHRFDARLFGKEEDKSDELTTNGEDAQSTA